jgi:hypothetical protein
VTTAHVPTWALGPTYRLTLAGVPWRIDGDTVAVDVGTHERLVYATTTPQQIRELIEASR